MSDDPAAEIERLKHDLAACRTARDAERAEAEAEQARLTFELGHRVKNTLSVVQALAGQTLRSKASREEALEAFSARILALSRANDVILNLGWTEARLEAVARAVLASPDLVAGRTTVEGPDVVLPASSALAFAMALHELASNAQRHGALSHPDGRVTLAWRLEQPATGPGTLHLTWRERGGPVAAAPEKRGFGLRLIEQSLRTAFGRGIAFAFEPEGFVCTVTSVRPADATVDAG